jgi:hypothetical protein
VAVDHQQGGDQRHDGGHMAFHALQPRFFCTEISRIFMNFMLIKNL